MKSGLTLIELLLVIAIILILSAATTPFLSQFLLRHNYSSTVNNLLSTIRKAQSYSLSGKNNTLWGVCLNGNNIRLFTGSCNSPTFSQDVSYPANITISGLSATTFSLLRGEPNTAQTISVTSSLNSTTVIINAAGGITKN